MTDYQLRVINEEVELDNKIEKLHVFIMESEIFKSLSIMEQGLLRDQLCIMRIYRDILRQRIKVFNGESDSN